MTDLEIKEEWVNVEPRQVLISSYCLGFLKGLFPCSNLGS